MKKDQIKNSLLVIIPARDEEIAVGNVIKGLQHSLPCDIVVVDDVSSDATIQVARQTGVHVIPLTVHLGSWGAVQTGMRYALKEKYETVATVDGDGQHKPSTVPVLLDYMLQSKTDVVVGSYIKRGSWQRKLAWRLFQSITGLAIKDLTSGLRVYNQKAIALLSSPEATLLDYQDLGVLLLLQKEGLRVAEFPCVMLSRVAGHSRIFSTWFEVFKYMAHTLLLSFSRKNDIGVKGFRKKAIQLEPGKHP
jgi:glycosyltransferase involved in cell wall biosynthesis